MEEAELCFPHLNSSCWKPKRPRSHTLLVYVLLSCISLLTVTLNLLVVVSISHFRQLHTPTNLLLLSLAVSDLVVGLLWVFQIMLIDGCWLLGDLMCTLYCVVDFTTTSTSIGIMVLISVDRYVAICDPLRYSIKVTQRRAQLCVSLCWVSSVFFFCALMKDSLKQPSRFDSCTAQCVIGLQFVEHVVGLIFSFVAPITVIVVLYVRVFVVVVSQARALRSHVAAVSLQRSVKVTAMKSELKAARSLGVVVLVFVTCIFPYFCVALIGFLVDASSAAFVIFLFYFNSCLNPVIYAFLYPWFRKSIRLIVTLQVLKPGSSMSTVL